MPKDPPSRNSRAKPQLAWGPRRRPEGWTWLTTGACALAVAAPGLCAAPATATDDAARSAALEQATEQGTTPHHAAGPADAMLADAPHPAAGPADAMLADAPHPAAGPADAMLADAPHPAAGPADAPGDSFELAPATGPVAGPGPAAAATPDHLPGPPDPGPFSPQALAADIAYLASRPRDGRAPPEPLRAWLTSRLESMGYAVTTPEVVGYPGRNVVGMTLGGAEPKRSVVVSAHFDSVQGSPGADDNASGVAAVLAVAAAQAERQAPLSLVVALWDLEERGLLGSDAWAAQARALNLELIHSLVLESVGYRDPRPLTQQVPWTIALAYPKIAWQVFTGGRRGNFVAAVGNQPQVLAAFAELALAENLPQHAFYVPNWLHPVARFTTLWRSDHASFWSAGYPATMLTDTADLRNPNYHQPSDLPATLDLDYLAQVARLANAMVDQLRSGRWPGAPQAG